MKAMILAAGLGTRLRPLTDDRPKALVTLAGRTLLDIALARLRGLGVSEVIVNAHHFAGMIADYLKANDNFGMHIEISREDELLDTGGGLKQAAYFFAGSPEPFFVHNVDVLSSIDLARMVRFHQEHAAVATLAVQSRETSRYLLFDARGQLCGRRAGRGQQPQIVRPSVDIEPWAFSGIHVLSPRLLDQMEEEGAFSIIATYMRLAAEAESIVAFRADGAYWRDLGRAEQLAGAERDVADGVFRLP